MKRVALLLLGGSLLLLQAKAQQKTDVQAHRGGMALMPENTIPAMLNGLKLGARTLELDCIITADQKVVVSHDAYMSAEFMRYPNGTDISKATEKSLALYGMTYDSIRQYDAGSKPHPRFPQQVKMKTYKPLLSALIDSVEQYIQQHHLKPVNYNIETKSDPAGDGIYNPAPAVFVALLMAVIEEKKIADRVTIQSFDPRTLQVLHQSNPRQKTALLVGNRESFAANIANLGFTPTAYSPNFQLVTLALVKEAHAKKCVGITLDGR
ncbi:glycerophosphodiester phosphodiesterase family protein [Chitinophaga nivalis]|uniref:Glycerophosphodiester phosphodiesterase family protein n=1 Tax=Chitinophaga nivalis TaxID=2991709 RepID=A0ABT3IES0_9BACT|nr:glycerophosphodiester phosphodiesterase family protein [Chitinophaga nivalis]MCW3467862.1 glycerophosphodiester phosphodiesterase family protein [Chitinophaga nivalis]MCW3482446.1 glycerophosphodiester phosphodiesterase family protein [Chitinophaga nivalis]